MRLTLFFLFSFFFALTSFSHEDLGSKKHIFTENKGQWNDRIKFKAEVEGATVYFESNAFHYQFINIPNYHAGNQPEDSILRGHVFNAKFIGSNTDVTINKEGESGYYNNYFLGNEKEKWQSFVRSYQLIEYNNLYNGIDLEVYAHNGFLKYDYYVQPGSSANQIRVEYEGVDNSTIQDGKLVLSHSLGEMVEEEPYAYQLINGEQVEVACNYKRFEDGRFGFEFPNGYNQELELVIDPTLIFSTYSGSSADNFGQTATYDNLGNGYMGGIVRSIGYITTTGAFNRTYGGGSWDIAITKFNSLGTNLIYSTYLGGSGTETVHSLVADDSSNLYLLGVSSSTDYPLSVNSFKSFKTVSGDVSTEIIFSNLSGGTPYVGGCDIVVTKLSSQGDQLLGSTYFGGNGSDGINRVVGTGNSGLNFNYGDSHRGEIVLDSSGFCYIGTCTQSNNLSNTIGSYQGSQDGLIVKFSTNLDSVIWSRYIGGSFEDAIYSLKVIDSNKVLIGGGTRSFGSFPISSNPYQQVAGMGRSDGFISIVSADGSVVEKSTFIGTSNYDQVYFIEFDRFNNIYGYGQTQGGSSFPIKNAPVADTGAGQFFVKLDRDLDSLKFSTTFGDGLGASTINISPAAFLVDRCQNIYASGWGPGFFGNKSLPSTMPLANNDPIYSNTDNEDFYLYVLNREADSILYASYFGGNNSGDHIDGGTSRFDKDGVIYQSVCASCGSATNDFPTTPNAFSSTDNSPNCNNALFKFDFQILINASFSTDKVEFCLKNGSIDSVNVVNTSVGSTNTTWNFYGDTVVSMFTDTTLYFATPGTYLIRQVVFDSICAVEDFKDIIITVKPDDINISIAATDTIQCLSDSVELFAFTDGFASDFVWSENFDFSNPLALNSSDSTPTVKLQLGINRFYVRASDPSRNACEKVDSVDVYYFPVDASAFASSDTVCFGDPVQFNATFLNVDSFAWDLGNSVINSIDTNFSYAYTSPGTYTINLYYRTDTCDTSRIINFDVTVLNNDLSISIQQDTLYCGVGDLIVNANTSGTAIKSYVWSSSDNFTDTLNASITDDFFIINEEDSGTYYLKISNNYCETTDSIKIVYVPYLVGIPPINDSACFTNFSLEFQPTLIGLDSFRINFGNGLFTTTDSTPLIRYNQPGNYTIDVLGYNSTCFNDDTVSFNIELLPNNIQLLAIPDTITCNLSSIDLVQVTNGTANEFIWSSSAQFSDTLNNSLIDSSITINPNSINNYYIRAKDKFCFKDDTVQVEPIQFDLQLGTLPDSVCTGFQQTLPTTIIGLDSFRINYGNLSTTNNQTPTINITNPGIFNIELIGTNARCRFKDTLTDSIRVFRSVEIEPIIDSMICLGDTIQITANTFGTGRDFIWDDSPLFDSPFNVSDSFITISPNLVTNYYFRAENVICSAEDTFQISTELVDVSVDDLIAICLEDTIDIQAVVNAAINPLSFNWSPIDSIISGQNSTLVTVAPKADIFFYLESTSSIGCKDFDSLEVMVNLPAFNSATILATDSLYKGQQTQLSTNRNGSNLVYQWEPAEDLDNPNSPNPNLVVNGSKEYKVTITDLNTGCVVVAFRRLFVFEVNCAEPDIFIPTAFSPNKDLTNDILFVRGANISEVNFQLFNRWGELVFETNDVNEGWDGKYKGREADPGVFSYQLRAVCFDGQEFYNKGNITLIR